MSWKEMEKKRKKKKSTGQTGFHLDINFFLAFKISVI